MRPAFLLSDRPAPPPPRASAARPTPAAPSIIAAPPAWELARRRVAVRLPEGAEPGGMRVLHHLLTAPPWEPPATDPTADAPPPDGAVSLLADAATDLARHHHGEFCLRLASELASTGAARLLGFAGTPLHLALPLRGATAALAAFAPPLIGGIEIDCAEAATDLAGFAALRAATAERGIALAIGGITAELLAIAEPESLGADLLILAADPSLAEAGARVGQLRGAVGAGRLLLAGVDSEDWLRWGVTQGIRRFQGAQIDMLLAAARRLVCAHSALCPLPVCAARAAGMGAAVRAGCHNLALLDRAA